MLTVLVREIRSTDRPNCPPQWESVILLKRQPFVKGVTNQQLPLDRARQQ